MKNPYEILGVSPQATIVEVKRARRRLCAKNHPDQGGDPVIFNMINEAYNKIISNQAFSETSIETRKSHLRHNTLFSFRVV